MFYWCEKNGLRFNFTICVEFGIHLNLHLIYGKLKLYKMEKYLEHLSQEIRAADTACLWIHDCTEYPISCNYILYI